MSVSRAVCLSISLGLLAAACGGGTQQSGGSASTGSGGTTTSSSKSSSTASTSTSGSSTTTSGTGGGTTATASSAASTGSTSTGTVTMCAGPGGCMSTVCPPNLLHLEPNPAGSGLVLSWQEMGACDTVEIESEYGLIGYPSNMNPPGAPQFSVPGTMMSITDVNATGVNMYTYHARCVIAAVDSCWSNELANNGHVADGG
jgi:hypothetical protein